jgi:hypothetical protein
MMNDNDGKWSGNYEMENPIIKKGETGNYPIIMRGELKNYPIIMSGETKKLWARITIT